ncbi:E3 ubiquitin-protein ligase TRIM17-like [Antedon mediterranea]|uniref:E3 ubiquitin-protein ligase TRIM17-like n=1 Tax=Antedon mediterranea TaxID=105859 RepID=UPI003AF76507
MASESSLFEDADKDFLTCSICKEIFNHPKQLKCMHNFCQDCLDPLLQKGKPSKIKCPLCREEVELELETGTLVKKARERNIKTPCQKHPNNHLEYFCQTCQVPVCLGCTVVDHVRQSGHNLLNLQDHSTRDEFKEKITEQITKMEKLMPSFEKNIKIADDTERNLIESLERTKKDIQETAKGLIEEIKTHANSLIEKVNEKAEAIQKKVEHHREAAEIRVMSATSLNRFATNLCKHGLNAEIMSSAKDLLRRMSELQQEMKDLAESGELRFIKEKEFKLGKVEECMIQVEY